MSRIELEGPPAMVPLVTASALGNNTASWRRSLEQTELASWFLSNESRPEPDGEENAGSAQNASSGEHQTADRQKSNESEHRDQVRTSDLKDVSRTRTTEGVQGRSRGVRETRAVQAQVEETQGLAVTTGQGLSAIPGHFDSGASIDEHVTRSMIRGVDTSAAVGKTNASTDVSQASARVALSSDVLDIVTKRTAASINMVIANDASSKIEGQASEVHVGTTDGANSQWRKRVTYAFMAEDGLIVWLRDADVSTKNAGDLVRSANEWGRDAGISIRKMYLNGHLIFERKDAVRRKTF